MAPFDRRRLDHRLVEDLAARAKLQYKQYKQSDKWFIERPGKIAERVLFRCTASGGLCLLLWPADTVTQARRFYQVFHRADFSLLKKAGWRIVPNLHFSYRSKHLVYADVPGRESKAEEFFDYFSDAAVYRQRSADQETLTPLLAQWLHDGWISPGEQAQIKAEFIDTRRPHMNVVPGYSFEREWPGEEVNELERTGKLEAHMVEALGEVLKTWGEDGLADPSETLLPAAADEEPFDPDNEKDARERIERTIVQRRGQQGFRESLISAYEGKCAMTGCSILDVLEAAHIVPYRGEHTDKTPNGLLLRADLHTLFDCRLVAIDPDTMEVLLAPRIADSEYKKWCGRRIRLPKTPKAQPNTAALRKHLKACRNAWGEEKRSQQ